jgi:hypothetical protein
MHGEAKQMQLAGFGVVSRGSAGSGMGEHKKAASRKPGAALSI